MKEAAVNWNQAFETTERLSQICKIVVATEENNGYEQKVL